MSCSQTAVYSERIKRDISSDESSDASHESSESDVSSDESRDAISDECERLASYIELDLSSGADLPETFQGLRNLLGSGMPFDLSVIRKTAPAFFNLLADAPLLFSGLSDAINATSDFIVIPPNFGSPPNLMAYGSLAALSTDFLAVACASCSIALNRTQIVDIRRLFGVVLPVFFVFSRECDLLTLDIVEQAVADVDPLPISASNVVLAIDLGVGVFFQLTTFRHLNDINTLRFGPSPADVTAAAQSILDGFLFTINEFCGIPPLSNATLALLDEYFLVELVNQVAL